MLLLDEFALQLFPPADACAATGAALPVRGKAGFCADWRWFFEQGQDASGDYWRTPYVWLARKNRHN
jgi:hypothetical protein